MTDIIKFIAFIPHSQGLLKTLCTDRWIVFEKVFPVINLKGGTKKCAFKNINWCVQRFSIKWICCVHCYHIENIYVYIFSIKYYFAEEFKNFLVHKKIFQLFHWFVTLIWSEIHTLHSNS